MASITFPDLSRKQLTLDELFQLDVEAFTKPQIWGILYQSADAIKESAATSPADLIVCKYTLSICKNGSVCIEGKIPKGCDVSDYLSDYAGPDDAIAKLVYSLSTTVYTDIVPYKREEDESADEALDDVIVEMTEYPPPSFEDLKQMCVDHSGLNPKELMQAVEKIYKKRYPKPTQSTETILLSLAAERAGVAKTQPDDEEIVKARQCYTATLKSIHPESAKKLKPKDSRQLGPLLVEKTPREKLLMDIVASPKLRRVERTTSTPLLGIDGQPARDPAKAVTSDVENVRVKIKAIHRVERKEFSRSPAPESKPQLPVLRRHLSRRLHEPPARHVRNRSELDINKRNGAAPSTALRKQKSTDETYGRYRSTLMTQSSEGQLFAGSSQDSFRNVSTAEDGEKRPRPASACTFSETDIRHAYMNDTLTSGMGSPAPGKDAVVRSGADANHTIRALEQLKLADSSSNTSLNARPISIHGSTDQIVQLQNQPRSPILSPRISGNLRNVGMENPKDARPKQEFIRAMPASNSETSIESDISRSALSSLAGSPTSNSNAPPTPRTPSPQIRSPSAAKGRGALHSPSLTKQNLSRQGSVPIGEPKGGGQHTFSLELVRKMGDQWANSWFDDLEDKKKAQVKEKKACHHCAKTLAGWWSKKPTTACFICERIVCASCCQHETLIGPYGAQSVCNRCFTKVLMKPLNNAPSKSPSKS